MPPPFLVFDATNHVIGMMHLALAVVSGVAVATV